MAASRSTGAKEGLGRRNTYPSSGQDPLTGLYTEVYAMIDDADDRELRDALSESTAMLLPNASPGTDTLATAITARLSQLSGLLEANGGLRQTRDLILYLATRNWDLNFSLSPTTRTTTNETSKATSQIPAEKKSDGKGEVTLENEAAKRGQAQATSVDQSKKKDTRKAKKSQPRTKKSTLPQPVQDRIKEDADFGNQVRPPYVLPSDTVPPVITDPQLVDAWNRATSARNTEIMIIHDRTRSENRAEAFVDYDRNWAGSDNFPVYQTMKAFADRHTLLRIEMVNIILKQLDLGHVTNYQDGLDLWNGWLLSQSLGSDQTEVGVGYPATTEAPTTPAPISAQVESQSSTAQLSEDMQGVRDGKRGKGTKRKQGNDCKDGPPSVQKKPRRDGGDGGAGPGASQDVST